MFPTEETYHGGKVDADYVANRAKWKPHDEVTQFKGDGEAHPLLSPDDEFADYENWDVANLDRTQVVKGGLDTDGELQEKVYHVVWSGDRAADANGKVAEGGNTVDLETARWRNTIGASELATVWTDPDFDPAERAFYHLHVLEIPTPRWVVYDAVRLDIELPA